MTNEERLIIATCQSYFNNEYLTVPENIDFKAYYELAKDHNIIGIAHCALSKNTSATVPDGVRKLFRERFFDLVYIYENQTNLFAELSTIFDRNKIRYIPFKGAVLRDMYPVAEARSMGDIDILIDSNDVDKVKKALTDNGFSLTAYNSSVYNFEKNGELFEIHTRLVDDLKNNIYSNALESAEFDGYRGVLNNNLHLAYLINHTANHLRNSGAGIRFVLDIAVMLRETQIDIDEVFSLLEQAGLTAFGSVLLSVCNEWFGYGKAYTENTAMVQEYLLKNGVFGNKKSDTDRTLSRLIQLGALDNSKNGTYSPAKMRLRLAFPPYSALRKAEYITFLDGKPYLLPMAWVYRLGYNLKHSRRSMFNTIKNVDDKNMANLAKEELNFFEEIGLL